MLIRPVRGQPEPLHFISHQLQREVHTAGPTGRGAQLRLHPHGLGLGEQNKAGPQVNPERAQPGISSHPIHRSLSRSLASAECRSRVHRWGFLPGKSLTTQDRELVESLVSQPQPASLSGGGCVLHTPHLSVFPILFIELVFGGG